MISLLVNGKYALTELVFYECLFKDLVDNT